MDVPPDTPNPDPYGNATDDQLSLRDLIHQAICNTEDLDHHPSEDDENRITESVMALVDTAIARGDAGQRLRAQRTARTLSGRELSRRVGVNQSVLVRIEQGRLRPAPELLKRLFHALDVPPGERARIVWGMAQHPAYAHLVNITPPPGSCSQRMP